MIDITLYSIANLRKKIVNREVSASDVCESVLSRVEVHNSHIGAISYVLSSSAKAEASAVDKSIAEGREVGKIAGIPVIIKDIIDTVPAICSAGLPFLSEYKPAKDAAVVEKLRKEGAVVIGVAATDSGAFGVVTPAVKNPNYPNKIAGGSSGGSAAAVAKGFCAASIGTDTGGSIRIPAACCGITGFKPTYGRVSTQGVRPLASSVDHVGPLARTVSDIRSIMEVIDPDFEPVHKDLKARPIIGIPKKYYSDASDDALAAMNEGIKRCQILDFDLREVEIPTPDEVIPSHIILALTEAALFYLGQPKEIVYPDFVEENIKLGCSFKGYEYLRAIMHRREFTECFNAVFKKVDFLITPTLPVKTPDCHTSTVRIKDVETDILMAMIRYTAAFDQTGHPAIALPLAAKGADFAGSLQLVGQVNSDYRLLTVAEEIELSIGTSMSLT